MYTKWVSRIFKEDDLGYFLNNTVLTLSKRIRQNKTELPPLKEQTS